VQTMTLWMLAWVIHPQWIMTLGLELLVGIDRCPFPRVPHASGMPSACWVIARSSEPGWGTGKSGEMHKSDFPVSRTPPLKGICAVHETSQSLKRFPPP